MPLRVSLNNIYEFTFHLHLRIIIMKRFTASSWFAVFLLYSSSTIFAQVHSGTSDMNITIDPLQGSAGNNYQTLQDFVNQVNAVGDISGNIVALIQGDLTEPINLPMKANVAAGKTITIKPGPGLQPTINFTDTFANAGYKGHWVLGTTLLTSPGLDTPYLGGINNLVIDGSNNGSDSQDLTITNFSGTPTAASDSRIINIVGSSNNITIKNCKLINRSTAGTAGCIEIYGRNNNTLGAGNAKIPTSVTLHNNYIYAQEGPGTGSAGYALQAAINSASSPALLADQAITELTVTSNTIWGKQRGISFTQVAGMTIDKNVIDLDYGHSGTAMRGIFIGQPYAGAGAAHTNNITRNHIQRLKSLDVSTNQSHAAMECQVSPGSSAAVTMNIHNNIIGGWNIPGNAAGTFAYRGISISSSAGNAKIYNNSIHMGPTLSTNTGTGSSMAGILFNNPTASTLKIDIQNNIVRMGNITNAPAMRINSTHSDSDLTINNNIYYHQKIDAHSLIINRSATLYATLAEWKAATQLAGTNFDSNSQEIDPFVGGGKSLPAVIPAVTGNGWKDGSDLHWTSPTIKPGGLRGFDKLTDVGNDLDGDARFDDLGESYPGADELPDVAMPVSVSAFSID